MRLLSAIVAGLGLALLVVGLAILPMTHPAFTKALSQRYSLVAQSGLSPQRVFDTAEQVRRFVVGSGVDSLPATVDGRPGFDAGAVSHLRDVRTVLERARIFTVVLAVVLAAWLGVQVARRRFSAISAALFVGAGVCVVIVGLGALAGGVDFESFFVWFHGLFFSAGTWQFSENSLLIEVFPEGFWVAAGVTWGALAGLGAVLLALGGWLFARLGRAS